MRMIWLLLALICSALWITGCEHEEGMPDFDFQPTEADKLTAKEQEALLWHARQFVAKSKKVKLRDEHRKIIRTTDPQIQ